MTKLVTGGDDAAERFRAAGFADRVACIRDITKAVDGGSSA